MGRRRRRGLAALTGPNSIVASSTPSTSSMPRTDLDRALLAEDLTLEVGLQNVDSLNPLQLAIVAAREDLDRMVQLRACAAFIQRKTAFEAAGGTEDPSQGLFALPLDTRLSDRIEELTPTELALAPFNTSCMDAAFPARAALRFRRLARDYQADLSSAQLPSPSLSPAFVTNGPPFSALSSTYSQDGGSGRTFVAGSCSFSWADEPARTVGPVEVKLEEDEIIVVSRNQPLFNVLASRLCVFLWLEGTAHGGCQEMTIQLEAYDAIMQERTRLGPSFTLRLSLGMVPDDALSTLASVVDDWHQRFDFLISRLPAEPTPSEGFTPMPPSPPPEYATISPQPSPRGGAFSNLTRAPDAHVEPDEDRPGHSQPLPAPRQQPSEDLSGPNRYLSRSPARPQWTAGFWVRLFAILQAVCPQAGIRCPDFTRAEIKILSHRADDRKLPDLPDKPFPKGAGHAPPDRLGLEEIYLARDRMTLDQCRNVLLGTDYPELQKYAQTMGKIVRARDVFFEACSYIVRQDLAIKNLDSPGKMSRKHLELVRDLRESEVQRLLVCTEQNLRLIRTSKFARHELEPSAHRRFEAALAEIVQVEDGIQREEEVTL